MADEPKVPATEEGAGSGDSPKTFTQAEVDALISKRLARETKKPADPATQAIGLDGVKVPLGVDPAVNEAKLQLANQRLVAATAQAEALKLDIEPQYIGDVVKLADLASIEVSEDGTIDSGEIAKKIAEVLKRVPMFQKPKEDTKSGFKLGGEGNQQGKKENGWDDNTVAKKPWNKFQK